MDMFLLGIAAVLILTLVEMVEDRRKDFIINKQACEITRLYCENHRLENIAQELMNNAKSN